MYQLETSIEIDTSAARVWEVLLAFPQYPTWNPFIKRVVGEAVVGNRLEVTMQPPGASAMTFRPKVLASSSPSELRWIGHVLLPGVFDGEHAFRIEPMSQDRVLFHQVETFSGLLVPFAKSFLRGTTKKGFESMNVALKHRAESQSRNTA
jgi:hypothetical protein